MKQRVAMAVSILIGILFLVLSNGWADEKSDMKKELDLADDITKETLIGPGNVQITTGKDILMSFGGQLRVIPTAESNWDFGMSDHVTGGFLGGALSSNFFGDHPNESGWLNDSYIRNEDRLYFNALPKDRKWSFYAALEFDDVWETATADNRSGKTGDYSKFGLERLHGTMALPFDFRLHAGYDIWGLDIIDGGGLVYGDDNPGLWFTKDYNTLSFNAGFFKLCENDFQTGPAKLSDNSDADRDLYAGHVTWKLNKTQRMKFFYAYDRMRSTPVLDLMAGLTQGALGISGGTPDVDSHHIGAYYNGTYNNVDFFLEGVYQGGSADDTGLGALGKAEDYDISAFALAAGHCLSVQRGADRLSRKTAYWCSVHLRRR